MNPLRRLAGQTAIYGLSSIVGRLLNYLLVPLYTRVLITSDYGIYTEMYAYVSILFVMLTYGMETTFFRFSESEQNKKKVYSTAFLSLVFTSFVFLALVLGNTSSIAQWLGYPNSLNYVIWFGLILVFDAISAIPFAKLRQENRPVRFAMVKLINISTNIGLNLFFILLCPFILKHYSGSTAARLVSTFFDSARLVEYIFISNLIATLFTFVLLIPDIPYRRISFDFRLWKRMLGYTWPLLIVAIAGSINLSIDKILLTYLLPENSDVMSQVGIYGACYKVSIIMTLFVQTFRYAADPFFFSESLRPGSKRIYSDVLTLFTIAASTIFLLTVMYLDVVILFIGEAYREGKNVIPILLMGNLFLGIFYNLSIWYKLTNRTIFGAILSVTGATITIILNVLLIPEIGYYGSAWAAFFAYLLMMILSYLIGKKHFPVPYNLKKFFLYLGGAAVLYLFSKFLVYPSTVMKYLVNTAFSLLYILLVFRAEKDLIRQLFSKG